MLSICDTARLTCSIPLDCSLLAAAISAIMSPTLCTLSTMPSSVLPDSATCAEPSATLAALSSTRDLMSLAAAALRLARLRTSEATTAKPRPCSPARAASTEALSASRLVWKAMSSIKPTISLILRLEASISCIAATARATTSPPSLAWVRTPRAS